MSHAQAPAPPSVGLGGSLKSGSQIGGNSPFRRISAMTRFRKKSISSPSKKAKCDYEIEREKRMEENRKRMEAMGILKVVLELLPPCVVPPRP